MSLYYSYYKQLYYFQQMVVRQDLDLDPKDEWTMRGTHPDLHLKSKAQSVTIVPHTQKTVTECVVIVYKFALLQNVPNEMAKNKQTQRQSLTFIREQT